MDAEDGEAFREPPRQIDTMVGGVNGLVVGVNRLVDGVRVMGDTLTTQLQGLTTGATTAEPHDDRAVRRAGRGAHRGNP